MLSVASGLIFALWAGRVLGPAGLGEITNLLVYASVIAVVGRWGQDYELLQLAATASPDLGGRVAAGPIMVAVLIAFGCAFGIGILALPFVSGSAVLLGILLSVLAALAGMARGKAAFNWSICAEVGVVSALAVPLVYLLMASGLELSITTVGAAVIGSAMILTVAMVIRTRKWSLGLPSLPGRASLRTQARRQFTGGMLMALTSTATYLAQSGLMVVPAMMLTAADVGIVRAAERGALALGMLFVLCETLVQPTVARLGAEGRMAEMRHLAARVSILLTATTVLCLAVLWLISEPLYQLLFGAAFTGSAKLFLIMSVGYLATAVLGPAGSYLAFSGRKRELSLATFAIVAIAVPVSIALTVLAGAEGFAYSFAVAGLIRSVILGVVCKRSLGFLPGPFAHGGLSGDKPC